MATVKLESFTDTTCLTIQHQKSVTSVPLFCFVCNSTLGCSCECLLRFLSRPTPSCNTVCCQRRYVSVPRAAPPQLQKLYLLTMASTAKFYEKNGFDVVPPNDVPAVLKAERALGTFVLSMSGDDNSLVCMHATNHVDALG